jgi:ubiquitin-protein ligase
MATTTMKLLMKEYQMYQEDLKGNDHTTSLYSLNPSKDSFLTWDLILFGPEDSPYEDGIFYGHIKFPINYPNDPPKVILYNFFHPNVYENGAVCISILHKGEDEYGYESISERWSPILKVPSVMISIISMITDPNFESPANIEASKLWRENYEEYKREIYTLVAKSHN